MPERSDETIAQLAHLIGMVNLDDDPMTLLMCEEIDALPASRLKVLLHAAVLALAAHDEEAGS